MPRLETVKNSNVFSWGEAYFELCSERPLGLMPSISNEMRLIALIEEPLVIEKILRHLSLWCGPPQFAEARSPHGEPVSNPQPIDGDFLIEEQIMPDYENVITD